MERLIGRARSAAEFLLLFAVAISPLPFGSTDPPVIAFWCVELGLCLILLGVTGGSVRSRLVSVTVTVIVCAYGLVAYLQSTIVSSPAAANPVWARAAAALDGSLPFARSINPQLPYLALGPPLAVLLAFSTSYIYCQSESRARRLITVIAWSGAAYAAFGILAHVYDPTKILWRTKQAYTTVVTSTFINRNTAAVYFGCAAIIWLMFLCEFLRRSLPARRLSRSDLPEIFHTLGRGKPLACVLSGFLCCAAMFLTGSRAGVGISVSVAIFSCCFFFRERIRLKLRHFAAATALWIAIFFLFSLSIGDRIASRGLTDPSRLETYKATLRMIADHPLLGFGLGSFAAAFPAYRGSDNPVFGVWDKAHNIPLEVAAEGGLPLAMLIVAVWVGIIIWLCRASLRRKKRLIFCLAGLAAALIGSLHSLIDFSLQITGFAIVACALIGAGLAQSADPTPAESTP